MKDKHLRGKSTQEFKLEAVSLVKAGVQTPRCSSVLHTRCSLATTTA